MVNRNSYFMAVDVQNLWYSCRHIFGHEFRVDYKALLDFVIECVVKGVDPVVNSTAYLVVSSNHDQTNFINALRQLDFNIKKRYFHFNKTRQPNTSGTSWDVGITADAFMQDEEYDTLILISGDGDFTYLIEPLRELGKDVIVVAFAESLSKQLAASATEVYTLSENIVYSPGKRFAAVQRESQITTPTE
tara:strand:- start:85 stop:654 length:570 start_codon:yes stop_codon:yes gene_type:complete